MSTVAILPMKPFDKAKQRLAPALGPGHRRALVEAMYADVLVATRRAAGVDAILVVTSDRNASRIAGGHGAGVIDDPGSGHSEAAALGIARALMQGATRTLLIPGDCPLIDTSQIDALLAHRVDNPSAVIVPDRHGVGTNALLLTPPDVLTPAFGEDSRQRHIELASAQGATPEVVEVPSLELDVDTPDDLGALRATLANSRGGAPHTRGMLSQMDRTATL